MTMKIIFMMLLLFIPSFSVMAQSTERNFQGYSWYDDGISFTYQMSIAEDATARFISATEDSPEIVRIDFQNYDNNTGWVESGAAIDIILMATQTTEQATNMPIDQTHGTGQIIAFQSGTGIRQIDTVSKNYLYTAQTDDLMYTIQATFPLTQYGADDALLTRQIETLDNLIQSLEVIPPDAMWMTRNTGGEIKFNGIHFNYDLSLAYRVEADVVDPVTGEHALNNRFGTIPGYTVFTFVGYPVASYGLAPQLFIMSADQFPDQTEYYGRELASLQFRLANSNNLPSLALDSEQPSAYPMLPPMHAAQTILAQPESLEFQNGEGLRFLVHYTQSLHPLSVYDLMYSYQGISDDNQSVIALLLPLYSRFLPENPTTETISGDASEVTYELYLDYLHGMLLMIEHMPQDEFIPAIYLLDDLARSICVNSPTGKQ